MARNTLPPGDDPQRYSSPPDPASRRPAEVEAYLAKTRMAAMRFNIRRAQGAPADEIAELGQALRAAIRATLEPKTSDMKTLDELVDAFFDVMTSPSRPPRGDPPPDPDPNAAAVRQA